jgi:DNA-binding beta-propeller fold protein YncE
MISRTPFALRRVRAARAGFTAVLAFGMVLASARAAAAAVEPWFPQPVYVTLQASNAVEILPSRRVCNALPGAHYLAVTPDGKRLLVSSATRPEAYLVDTETCARLATFDVGPVAQGVAISPDGRWGLVASQGDSTVAVIDIASRKRVKTLHFDAYPHNAAFTPDGKSAYVTLQGGTDVAVIDMRTLTQAREFASIKLPHNLDLSPDGKTLWIRDIVGHVADADAATGKQLSPEIPVGPSHAGIDAPAHRKYVFTGAIGGTDVDVIDPRSFKVVKRVAVGQGPHGVRSSRDGRWVYAAVTGTTELAVIDARTLKVVQQVSLEGKFPFWIAVAGKD